MTWQQPLVTLPLIKIRFFRYTCCSKQFLLWFIFIKCSIFYTFKIVDHFIKSVLSNESNSILNVLKFVPRFLASIPFDTDTSAVQNRKFWVAERTNHGGLLGGPCYLWVVRMYDVVGNDNETAMSLCVIYFKQYKRMRDLYFQFSIRF